jgi:acetyltransferase-like isoleucine patch superfamily enzyme
MNRVISALLSRVAEWAPGGSSVRPRLQRWRGVHIGDKVWIGLFVHIDELHPDSLSIGDNCTIGIRTSILTHFYAGPRRPANNGKVIIENDVFIGPHCLILPNVRIGQGAVVQAGTIVSQNVPPHTLWGAAAAGPLATVTAPLTADREYAEFLRGLKPVTKHL